jgi:hypothetical protein
MIGRLDRIAFMAILVMFSCAEKPMYSVKMINKGTRDVREARVRYGRFVSDEGLLVPNLPKEELGVSEPLPDRLVVEWKDDKDEFHQVFMQSAKRESFNGVLVIEIDGTNQVRVHTEPRPGSVLR